MSDNEQAAADPIPEAPQEQQIICTALLRCFDAECRNNDGRGECNLKCIEIGFEGGCINRSPRDEEYLRHYLKQQGLSPEGVEEIIRQAKRN